MLELKEYDDEALLVLVLESIKELYKRHHIALDSYYFRDAKGDSIIAPKENSYEDTNSLDMFTARPAIAQKLVLEGITTAKQLMGTPPCKLASIRGLGIKALMYIIEVLEMHEYDYRKRWGSEAIANAFKNPCDRSRLKHLFQLMDQKASR